MYRTALILGISGQDGSYLAEILLEQGWEVFGMIRRSSADNLFRIKHLIDQKSIHLFEGDLLDPISVQRIIKRIKPLHIYNVADQDHVGFSLNTPAYSSDVTYKGVANLLEIMYGLGLFDKTTLYQPLTALMFGATHGPQTEHSTFDPQSPYAIAKTAVYYLCKHYRETHGARMAMAWLYNHDSIRRQSDYLLHKIAIASERISHGDQETFSLNNDTTLVDIGCAKEYMEAVCKMTLLETPHDFVIGTGKPHSIGRLVQVAFNKNLIPMTKFTRPTHNDKSELFPDIAKAQLLLKFNPKRTGIEIVRELCDHYCSKLYGGK